MAYLMLCERLLIKLNTLRFDRNVGSDVGSNGTAD